MGMITNIFRKKHRDINEPLVFERDGYVSYVIPALNVQGQSARVEIDGAYAIVRASRSRPGEGTYRERSEGAIESRILLPTFAIAGEASLHVGRHSLTLRVPVGDDEGIAPGSVRVIERR
jgi:hypothetical protein